MRHDQKRMLKRTSNITNNRVHFGIDDHDNKLNASLKKEKLLFAVAQSAVDHYNKRFTLC